MNNLKDFVTLKAINVKILTKPDFYRISFLRKYHILLRQCSVYYKIIISLLFLVCANFLEASEFTIGDIEISDAKNYALAETILKTTPETQFIDLQDGIKGRIFICETTEDFTKSYDKKRISPIEIVPVKNKIKIYCFEKFFAEKEISDCKNYLILFELTVSVMDKTPILGDIPIIGKLFQKKAESRQLFLKWVKLK